jgi:hypothetical protein
VDNDVQKVGTADYASSKWTGINFNITVYLCNSCDLVNDDIRQVEKAEYALSAWTGRNLLAAQDICMYRVNTHAKVKGDI